MDRDGMAKALEEMDPADRVDVWAHLEDLEQALDSMASTVAELGQQMEGALRPDPNETVGPPRQWRHTDAELTNRVQAGARNVGGLNEALQELMRRAVL